jgi:hypothetical protein
MDKYSPNVCISSTPIPRFPCFYLRRAVTGTNYSRGENCTSKKKKLLCMTNLSTMLYMIPMLNTIYSGMLGTGASLNSSIIPYASNRLYQSNITTRQFNIRDVEVDTSRAARWHICYLEVYYVQGSSCRSEMSLSLRTVSTLCTYTLQSRIFSPVENTFHTKVPTR